MKCPKCSEESPAELNFCRKCGARLLTRDPESTSVITKKMVKDNAVVFPATGSQVVPLEKPKEPELPQYKPPVWPALPPVEKYQKPEDLIGRVESTLPDEPLTFTMNPKFFSETAARVFEPRGLLRLRKSFIRRGGSWILKEGQTRIPDKEIFLNHAEVIFAPDKTFKNNEQSRDYEYQVNNKKTMIEFNKIETVSVRKGLLRGSLTIKLHPEKKISLLEIDPVIRELTLTIARKDLPLAEKLKSAIMYDLSTTKLKGLLG